MTKMTLREFTESEIKDRVPIGKPVQVILSREGYPDYSTRAISMVNAKAPEGTRSAEIGRFGFPIETEVKCWGNIIDGSERKFPDRIETQTWYAHRVQYFC